MISNASLVTDAIAARLARYRLLSVLVTLNGPDAELHDAQVGGTHFDATLEGIRRLRKHRIPVEGAIVVTRRNAHAVGATLALFRSLGVTKVAISRFSPAGYSTKNTEALLPRPADVASALAQGADAARTHAMQLFSTMPIPPCVLDTAAFPEIAFQGCPIGTDRQEFALGPRGEVRHCALHRDPIDGARDVLDASLDVAALLAAGDPHGYRAALPDACRGCAHASICAGGCGAAAVWATGTRVRDPFAEQATDAVRRLPLVV